MIRILYPNESKALDSFYINNKKIPGLLLMEQAATGFVKHIRDKFSADSRGLAVIGKGNNGGDGLAIARILRMYGLYVDVAVITPQLNGDAYTNLQYFSADNSLIELNEQNTDSVFNSIHYDYIIDALFGTGFHGSVEGIYHKVIQNINSSGAYIYSVDIPSGTNGADGSSDISIKADHTITFEYPKPGHFMYPGRDNTGKLDIVPIAPYLNNDELSTIIDSNLYLVDRISLKKRNRNSHKSDYGKLAVIAGSKGMYGAAMFSAGAAVRSGSGLTTYLGCKATIPHMQLLVPEAMAMNVSVKDDYLSNENILDYTKSYSALVLGPGLGRNSDTEKLVRDIAESDTLKIIDADALFFVASANIRYGKNTIVTPHTGEFSRLTGKSISEINCDPVKEAEAYAKSHNITVLLKGSTTVITDGITTYLVTAGTPAMAKGGSGDVLSGVIGALLSQGYSTLEAGYMGAFICGKAGEQAELKKGHYSMSPVDTIDNLGSVIDRYLED